MKAFTKMHQPDMWTHFKPAISTGLISEVKLFAGSRVITLITLYKLPFKYPGSGNHML